MFEQYAFALRDRFPGLLIEGDNYPPPPMKAFVAQALGYIKFILIAFIVFNINVFTFFNFETPGIYVWASENKVSVFIFWYHQL